MMSMTLLGESPDLDAALKIFLSTGHNAALGLTDAAHGPGWIQYRLPWRAELAATGASRLIDPSAIYSLLDAACAMTVWARTGKFAPYPTLDFRVDYLRAPTPGADIIGRGECYAITPDYAFMRGIAHEGDPANPVAHCSGAFMSYKERAS